MSQEMIGASSFDLWIEEKTNDYVSARFRVKKTLFSGKSEFQKVDIVETAGHGRMLLNDGLIMLTERDEAHYHEMISHVPLFSHPNPESVLVIGGGDGGTIREVIRHPDVKRAVMVEIDQMVTDACREFIPSCTTGLDDSRVDLRFEDGVAYVKQAVENGDRFDVILIDSTDPFGAAAPLFGTEFYGNVAKILGDHGIVVSQGESPYYFSDSQKKMMGVLKEHFQSVFPYNFSTVAYPGGLWTFTYATQNCHPFERLDAGAKSELNGGFRYYNQNIHRAAFAQPSFVLENFGNADSPF